MSQAPLTIGPEAISGDNYRIADNNAKSALGSTHSGATAPTSAMEGMQWIDTSADPDHVLKVYLGGNWISLATIDSASENVSLTLDGLTVLGAFASKGISDSATATRVIVRDDAVTIGDVLDKEAVFFSKKITLSGTSYTTIDTFPRGAAILLAHGANDTPAAVFAIARNAALGSAQNNNLARSAGILGGEQLELLWDSAGLKIRKNGAAYDGIYTVQYMLLRY